MSISSTISNVLDIVPVPDEFNDGMAMEGERLKGEMTPLIDSLYTIVVGTDADHTSARCHLWTQIFVGC